MGTNEISEKKPITPEEKERRYFLRISKNMIQDEDLFKLLKKRYNEKLEIFRKNNKKVIEGIFHETICMIENLECKLSLIYENAYPTREQFLLAQQSSDQIVLARIVKFYGSMRVDRELLDYALFTHILSNNVTFYTQYISSLGNDSLFWNNGEEWDIETFPAHDIFTFIENFKFYISQTKSLTKDKNEINLSEGEMQDENLERQLQKAETNQINFNVSSRLLEPEKGLTEDFFHRFAQGRQHFRKCINTHKKLQVFCLEITLTPQEYTPEQNRYALDRNQFALYGFTKFFKETYDLLTQYSKVEIGINSSVILQNILIFKGKPILDFRTIRAHIKEDYRKSLGSHDYWKTQPFKVDVRDLGILVKSLDSRYTSEILHRSTAARNAFEYWILSYFYRVDYFLLPVLDRVIESPFVYQHIDQVFVQAMGSTPETKKANEPRKKTQKPAQQHEFFSQLDFSKQQKHIWRITDLPEHVEEELRLITFMYSQKYIQRDDQAKLRLLTSIEYFMRLLQYKSDSTCIGLHPNTSTLEVSKNPLKKLSKQAKQYLTIFNFMLGQAEFLDEILASSEIGWRVKFFVTVFKKNNDEIRLSIKGIHELERRLKRFKDLTKDMVDQQTIPDLFKMEKLAAILLRRNQREALDYLKNSLIEDVFAFRLQLSYDQAEGKSIDLTFDEEKIAFNELLTHFLKDLKRTKKNSNAALLAFIGTRLLKVKRLSADITFFFSAKWLSDYDDEENKKRIEKVIENVQSYWKGYLKNKQINRKQTSQQSEGQNVENIAEQNKDSQHTPEMYDLSNYVFHAVSKYLTISQEKRSFIILKPYQDKTLQQLQSSIIDFYAAHALLCTWKIPLPAEKDKQDTEKDKQATHADKQDIKESNKDNSNEKKAKGGRPRRIDQFIKGHVISAKKQKDKNNKQNKKINTHEETHSN
ncbi:hypothetical protein ACG92Y_02100 [Acinetobacter ursingii]|uniref:hypothetical protein n=1 Tax=Acinetobacter ursingii TaxID=108980 RepID=UPI003AF7EB0B